MTLLLQHDNTRKREAHLEEESDFPLSALSRPFTPSDFNSLHDSFLFGGLAIFHSRSATTSLPLVVHSKVRCCPRVEWRVRVFSPGSSAVNPRIVRMEVNCRRRTRLAVHYGRMTNIQSPVLPHIRGWDVAVRLYVCNPSLTWITCAHTTWNTPL